MNGNIWQAGLGDGTVLWVEWINQKIYEVSVSSDDSHGEWEWPICQWDACHDTLPQGFTKFMFQRIQGYAFLYMGLSEICTSINVIFQRHKYLNCCFFSFPIIEIAVISIPNYLNFYICWPRWSRGNVLSSRTKVRGFKPGWGWWIFSGRKNPEHKSSMREL